MSDAHPNSRWWRTLPGVLTAFAGVLTAVAALIGALHQAGLFDGVRRAPEPSESALTATGTHAPDNAAAVTPDAAAQPMRPSATDGVTGWAIVARLEGARCVDLKLDVSGNCPAIGSRYRVVDTFRLIQQDPRDGRNGQIVTLGMVGSGQWIEVLDTYADGRHLHVRLRAPLRPIRAQDG